MSRRGRARPSFGEAQDSGLPCPGPQAAPSSAIARRASSGGRSLFRLCLFPSPATCADGRPRQLRRVAVVGVGLAPSRATSPTSSRAAFGGQQDSGLSALCRAIFGKGRPRHLRRAAGFGLALLPGRTTFGPRSAGFGFAPLPTSKTQQRSPTSGERPRHLRRAGLPRPGPPSSAMAGRATFGGPVGRVQFPSEPQPQPSAPRRPGQRAARFLESQGCTTQPCDG